MTNRNNRNYKGPVVSLLAALSVAAFGCVGPADASEPDASAASAELTKAPGATQTIPTAVLYLQDAGHVSGTLAVGELTDPAGPDFSEAINYIDEAAFDLTIARDLLVNRSDVSPAETGRFLAELGARQAARSERMAARRAAR